MAPGAARDDGWSLDRLLGERGPAILRVWEGIAAGTAGSAAGVRAAIAELLASPQELAPADPSAGALRAGTALTAAARGDPAALERGLALLPLAVRELAHALGAPLSPEDDRRLDAAIERARTAARARSNGPT